MVIGRNVLLIDGIEQFKSGLSLFVQEILGGNVSADIFRQIGEDAVDDMQSHCPVRTGYLRDHIYIKELTAMTLYITSEAPYSGFVEFGTSKMRAQPFFFPAINTHFKENFPAMFMRAVNDEWAFIVRKFSPRGFGFIKQV